MKQPGFHHTTMFAAGTGKTQMNGFRTKRYLLAGALAFTTACATGSKAGPSPMAVAPAQKPVAAAPAPAPAPVSTPAEEEDATALFASALKAYEAGDLDGARKGFEKVVAKAPQALNAQFNLGVIAEKQGRVDDARAAYEKALFLDQGHTPSVINLGLMYRQQGRVDDAIGLYERALKTPGHTHDVAVLNALTGAFRQAGKAEQAEATARRVLARSKDNPEAYKNLALIAYERGQFRLAELLMVNARKTSDKDPAIYNTLGMIYLKLDDRPRALAQFQKAVSLDEKFAPAYVNLGAMALTYRDYSGAERAFAKAVELEPGGVEGRLYLAYALDGQKSRDPKKGVAAGEAFEQVLSLKSDLPDAVCGAGWAYAADKTGWEKAIAFLDRCKGMESTSAQDKQLIQAKVSGLQNMLKTAAAQPPPEVAPEAGAPKEGAPATSGGGSMLNQLPQEAGDAPPETGAEAPPAGDTAAPASDTAAAPIGNTAAATGEAGAPAAPSAAPAEPVSPAGEAPAQGTAPAPTPAAPQGATEGGAPTPAP